MGYHSALRLKDLLGPVTRVKKKTKFTGKDDMEVSVKKPGKFQLQNMAVRVRLINSFGVDPLGRGWGLWSR